MSEASLAIAVRNHEKTEITIAPATVTLKEEALADADGIFCVQCAEDQASATKVVQKINDLLKQVESSRKLCKAELEKPIVLLDATAKEFAMSLVTARDLIAKQITDYQIEQRRIAQLAEQERQAKIRREQAEADRLKRESEEAKRKAEQAEINFAGKEAEEETKQQAEVKKQELVRQQQTLADTQIKKVAPPPKASGMVVREVPMFEVTDIHALYAANRDFVRMEPNALAINAALRSGVMECAGLRIWKETRTDFRS